MSEFLNRRAPRAKPASGVVSPVTTAEFSEFMGGIPDDSFVAGILTAATSAAVSFLGKDILTRTWHLTHWDWPVWGTMTRRNVGLQAGDYRREILLPYADDATVIEVKVYGDEVTEFINRGDAILLGGVGLNGANDEPAIEVEYQAGFGALPEDVPKVICDGIMRLAAFLYEHRGDCDASDAIQRSGAAVMLTPWRKAELMI